MTFAPPAGHLLHARHVRDHARLKARGVGLVAEREECPYGIDCGFRDPSGNDICLTQAIAGFGD